MPEPSPAPKVPSSAARAGYGALGVDSSQPCPACGKPLPVGKTAGCSARCRAELSRWRRVTALRQALLTIQAQVEDLLDLVGKLHGGRRRGRK
ncbi:MAG: hypothetical protein HY725_11805 [Candidatus Rokubacteria bacterium]|nr:hypothetical protein [Candidatus Rokubacteria bacterium]